MGNIQIKNVPEEIHNELRRRAEQAGMTVRDYVLQLLRRDQALPSRKEWLEAVRKLPRVEGGISAADLIREGRVERDRELMQRLGLDPDADAGS